MAIYYGGKPAVPVYGYCTKCCMTAEQRREYIGSCPMNFPEMGCPFYDKEKDDDTSAFEHRLR